jgi:hypothetical protein
VSQRRTTAVLRHALRRFAPALAGAVLTTLALAAPAPAAVRLVVPAGVNSGTCTVVPCGSLGYAYRVAAPGDVVKVAGGSYGRQDIPAIGGRASAQAVTIVPATGAAVHLGGFNMSGGGGVAIRNIHTGSLDIVDATNVMVQNGGGSSIWLNNVRNVAVVGGSYGGKVDKQPVMVGAYPESVNVTFDGVDFHDATATGPDVHTECVMANNVQGLTIRNSLFRNCAYFGVLISSCCGGQLQPRDVLLENNVFEHTYQWNGEKAPCAMMIGGVRINNLTFRNNTYETPVCFSDTQHVNTRFVGNLGSSGVCADGVRYVNNVWSSDTCSSSDRQAPGLWNDFAAPRAHDWHLKPGASAIDKASPTDHPSTDRDGKPRSGRPDAGAYEYGPWPNGKPGGGASARLIRRVSLSRKRICHRRTASCRKTKAKLRVRATTYGRIIVQIRRAKGHHKLVRRIRTPLRGMRRTVGIDGRKLARRRYRISVIVESGASRQKSRSIALRVV